jgi:WD40 repeat protein
MDEAVRAILKDVLARHGRELLDDPRRCENVLNENCPQAKREVAALIAALKEGLPQRLLGMPAASLTPTMVVNSAARVAQETGLRDDVARWAIQTWAEGLGLTIAVIDPQPRRAPFDAGADLRAVPSGAVTAAADSSGTEPSKDAKAAMLARFFARSSPAHRVIGALLIGQGVAQILYFYGPVIGHALLVYGLFDENSERTIIYLMPPIDVASIIVGFAVIRQWRLADWSAIVISVLGLLAYVVHNYILFDDLFIYLPSFLGRIDVLPKFYIITYLLLSVAGLSIYAGITCYLLQKSASVESSERKAAGGDASSFVWPLNPAGRAVRVGVAVAAVSVGLATFVGGLWDRSLLATLGEHGVSGYTYVAFSPKGQLIVSGGAHGAVKIWDADTGRLVHALDQGTDSPVRSVAFSPDGKWVASGSSSEDATVKIWDVGTGQLLRMLQGDKGFVLAVAFSPDGKRVASGSGDTVKIWDTGTWQVVQSLEHPGAAVTAVAFAPDGQRILTGVYTTGTIRIWDAGSGRVLRMLEERPESRSLWVNSASFSPDGKRIVVAINEDNNVEDLINVWNAETGELLQTLKGGRSNAAFSPDGTKVAAAGIRSDSIAIWEGATGRLLRTLKGAGGAAVSVAFSPDGRRIASGDWGGTVRIWNAE